ncbi:MAG: hypothetical protein E2O68_06470 [Deltaproteobacteria bacterium]|nr:MAG: hypothetical protein E2O68_06470 [Deltaproteobacteria bacterium]
MKIVIIILMLMPPNVLAIGTSYTFIIKVTPKRIHVISPTKANKDVTIIIKNESLSSIYGKVIEEGGSYAKFVAIPKNGHKTVTISGFKSGKNYYFVPLSPPYQELKLKVGGDPYEIPPEI